MSKPISTIGDYSILPISMPKTSSYPVQVVHSIYVRPHQPKIPTPSDSRSLFLVNVPIDSTEQHIRSIFSSLLGAGRFEGVTFENERPNAPPPSAATELAQSTKNKKRKHSDSVDDSTATKTSWPKLWDRTLHRSGSTAVALLVDARSVELALKAIKKANKSGEYPVWGEGVTTVPALGSARYLTHQAMTYPDKDELQRSVDDFMREWARNEEETAKLAKRQRNVPDEDGFITVTRGGRVGPARQHDAEEARKKELEKEEAKRKSMGDFYRFQGRERRKEEQGELLKRFEEDRKRVEGMKNERRGRFRPE